jgi:hypothetical protein
MLAMTMTTMTTTFWWISWVLAISFSTTSVVWSFTIVRTSRQPFVVTPTRTFIISSIPSISSCLYSSPTNDNDESSQPQPSLILDDSALQAQMQKLRSKYPVSESAYLAAAKERSKQQAASKERQATDADWQRIQREKAQLFGGMLQDDWEASRREAGNADSQILLPNPTPSSSSSSSSSGGTGDEDNEEPKLLLF